MIEVYLHYSPVNIANFFIPKNNDPLNNTLLTLHVEGTEIVEADFMYLNALKFLTSNIEMKIVIKDNVEHTIM